MSIDIMGEKAAAEPASAATTAQRESMAEDFVLWIESSRTEKELAKSDVF